MTRNKNSKGSLWLAAEDKALLELCEGRKVKKWRLVVVLLEQEFKIYGKSPKLCRERYFNYVDSTLNKGEWSKEEQAKLIQCHKTLGSSWAQIARFLPGRNQNAVKNKFNSKLRKALRNISSVCVLMKVKKIKEKGKTFYASLLNAVSKLVNAKFKKSKSSHSIPFTNEEATNFLHKLLQYQCVNLSSSSQLKESILKLADQIHYLFKKVAQQKEEKIQEEEYEGQFLEKSNQSQDSQFKLKQPQNEQKQSFSQQMSQNNAFQPPNPIVASNESISLMKSFNMEDFKRLQTNQLHESNRSQHDQNIFDL